MLPTVLPHMVGVDVGARIIPAHEVGGDLFDLFVLDDETLGLVIGDVCGKGIPAALYMAETRSLLRATATPDASPDVVLRRVNAHLRALNSSSMFVTCVYARLHLPTRTLLVARAGHEYPLCYTAAGTPRPLPYAVGQPLGMLPEPAIDVQRHALAAGDTVLLYTDGVTEATNATGAFFERERLHTTMQAAPRTAQDLCDVIVQQVAAFQGVAPQADDITLVAARLG
jgi:sigma-B regulation protein RsbU (phosphoserine phosphatase)